MTKVYKFKLGEKVAKLTKIPSLYLATQAKHRQGEFGKIITRLVDKVTQQPVYLVEFPTEGVRLVKETHLTVIKETTIGWVVIKGERQYEIYKEKPNVPEGAVVLEVMGVL